MDLNLDGSKNKLIKDSK